MQRFTANAAPVVSGLQPVADDLTPTVRDLGGLAPDLEATFRSLDPLIERSRRGLPALARTVDGARPVVRRLEAFLDELGPVLSQLNFNQARLAGFITNGTVGIDADFGGQRYNNVVPLVDPRSFQTVVERPEFDRGNAYLQPNFASRIIGLGSYESTDCATASGRQERLRRREAGRRAERRRRREGVRPASGLPPGAGLALRRQADLDAAARRDSAASPRPGGRSGGCRSKAGPELVGVAPTSVVD